jgi:drug/metabolite transporter (DMT)-like permease
MLLLLAQLLSALLSGSFGAYIAIQIRADKLPWWATIFGSLTAAASWAWMAKYGGGRSLLVMAILWNVAWDSGEYGTIAFKERPTVVQIIGIGLVMLGLALISLQDQSRD